MANLFDELIKLSAQTVRAVFHSAKILCVGFPPFVQVFCACCEKPFICAEY